MFLATALGHFISRFVPYIQFHWRKYLYIILICCRDLSILRVFVISELYRRSWALLGSPQHSPKPDGCRTLITFFTKPWRGFHLDTYKLFSIWFCHKYSSYSLYLKVLPQARQRPKKMRHDSTGTLCWSRHSRDPHWQTCFLMGLPKVRYDSFIAHRFSLFWISLIISFTSFSNS